MKNITIALYGILLLCLTSCNFSEKELYRIPYNYKGNILIVSGMKNGAAQLYKGKKRVYDIPSTGILVTQFEKDYGIIDKEFMYAVNSQEKILDGVHFQEDKATLDQNKIYAFYGSGYNIDFPGEKQVGVEILTICKPAELAGYRNEPFIKSISSLSSKDITYENLVKLKQDVLN